MKPTKLRLAVTSDIHLGQRRVSSRFIIKNLRRCFDEKLMAQLDLLVLAGDVFDELLSLNHEELPDIDLWIVHLLRLCKKHNVTLYVLEGTTSHDRGQPARFVTLNEGIANIGADLHYINELSIRYEERFDMNFLFVPDEWHHDPNETLRQVHELLAARNLTQVDFAFMHGNFKYQLPEVAKAPKHDEQAYLEIVKHAIFIGHIHTSSTYDRIIAQGSFDRYGHNEEEPKGFYKGTLYTNGVFETEFVENKGAKRFVTVDCVGLTPEQTLERARLVAARLEPESFIRLQLDPTNPYSRNLDELILEFPLLNWSKKDEDAERHERVLALKKDLDYQPIYITPENVVELMNERLANVVSDPKLKAAIDVQLNSLVNSVTPPEPLEPST